MNWKYKVLIVAGVVFVIASLCMIIKYQRDVIQKQQIIETSLVEQKQLADNIVRAQASYITKKDLESYAKDNNVSLDPIKDDLKKLGAEVKGVSVVHVLTPGQSIKDQGSTTVVPNPEPVKVDPSNPDPYKYLSNKQVLKLNEPFGDNQVPVGEVGFSAWKEKPWESTIYKRDYKVVNVIGEDEDGRHYVYNKFSVTSNGKEYDVKISDTKYVETLPEASFRFSPRLYAGVDGGVYLTMPKGAAEPNMQLFLFSHGKTKPDPNWVFLGVGGGYETVVRKFNFMFSPVNYNIGHHLPLVDNVFIGPSVSLDFSGNYTIMMGVRFGL